MIFFLTLLDYSYSLTFVNGFSSNDSLTSFYLLTSFDFSVFHYFDLKLHIESCTWIFQPPFTSSNTLTFLFPFHSSLSLDFTLHQYISFPSFFPSYLRLHYFVSNSLNVSKDQYFLSRKYIHFMKCRWIFWKTFSPTKRFKYTNIYNKLFESFIDFLNMTIIIYWIIYWFS